MSDETIGALREDLHEAAGAELETLRAERDAAVAEIQRRMDRRMAVL